METHSALCRRYSHISGAGLPDYTSLEPVSYLQAVTRSEGMPYDRSIRQRPLEREGKSVWRYMKLWKFEDLVQRQCLFFTRLRHIVDRELDPFEGTLADVNYSDPNINVDWVLREVLTPGQSQETIDTIRREFGDPECLRRHQEWVRDHTYVNCWFIGEFESERMWNEYAPDGQGVVVQSTIRKLRHSFDSSPGSIFIQPVIYYDPQSGQMVPVDEFHTPLYKHASHRHEQELRGFVVAPQIHGEYELHPDGIGVWVPVDLKILVERVRVSPGATGHIVEHVGSVLRQGALSAVRIERSALPPAGTGERCQ